MDSLLDITGPARFVIAFAVVLALIAVTAWLVRRFGSGALSSTGSRSRQPRLAVIDAATVDARRKLILVRRDNVEHLVMIGGPSDVVIEPNIVRAAAARDVSMGRAAPIPDTVPRPVPLEESSSWPLQPEPTPRPQRQAPPVASPTAASPLTVVNHQSLDVSVRAQNPDTLAELADALAAQPQPRVEPEPPAPPAVPAVPAVPERTADARVTTAANEQNLAEMAQRLEAVLRRPADGEPRLDLPLAEERPTVAPIVIPQSSTNSTESTIPEVRPVTPEPQSPAETKKFYETLEQEMASLLGRPTGKM